MIFGQIFKSTVEFQSEPQTNFNNRNQVVGVLILWRRQLQPSCWSILVAQTTPTELLEYSCGSDSFSRVVGVFVAQITPTSCWSILVAQVTPTSCCTILWLKQLQSCSNIRVAHRMITLRWLSLLKYIYNNHMFI